MKTLTLDILKQLRIRDDIAKILNEHRLVGRAAEIGVMSGNFTDVVLREWQGQVFYAVDTWERQSKEVYRERTDTIDYESCYQQMRAMAKRDPRICLLRGMSTDMAKFVIDNTLDWVFIDGNHSYGAVLADMDAWYPKVIKGGLFSGHDYGDDTNWPSWCEVKSAVDRWMKEHQMEFVVDKHGSSWWAIKG